MLRAACSSLPLSPSHATMARFAHSAEQAAKVRDVDQLEKGKVGLSIACVLVETAVAAAAHAGPEALAAATGAAVAAVLRHLVPAPAVTPGTRRRARRKRGRRPGLPPGLGGPPLCAPAPPLDEEEDDRGGVRPLVRHGSKPEKEPGGAAASGDPDAWPIVQDDPAPTPPNQARSPSAACPPADPPAQVAGSAHAERSPAAEQDDPAHARADAPLAQAAGSALTAGSPATRCALEHDPAHALTAAPPAQPHRVLRATSPSSELAAPASLAEVSIDGERRTISAD